jgi:hypothetical protein
MRRQRHNRWNFIRRIIHLLIVGKTSRSYPKYHLASIGLAVRRIDAVYQTEQGGGPARVVIVAPSLKYSAGIRTSSSPNRILRVIRPHPPRVIVYGMDITGWR